MKGFLNIINHRSSPQYKRWLIEKSIIRENEELVSYKEAIKNIETVSQL